jgi:sugar transferase (PEP-CTERM/EpsH1 system associated)
LNGSEHPPMSRLRIMHVIDSLGMGGTEEGVRKLLAGLDPSAFEQTVCTVAPSPEVDAKSGSRVISLGRSNGERKLLVGKMKAVFERERPHVVHSRNWGAIEAVVAARMAGVGTVVHSEHGLELPTYRRQPWRRNVIRRLCFTWADRVFAVSGTLRTYYAQQLWMAESRMGVIANGVDTEKFRRQEEIRRITRRKLGADADTLVIGTVGRLDPVKDHRTVFQAVDSFLTMALPVQLVIVGEGPERRALEAEIQARTSLARRTSFVGETSNIVSQLNSFDIFVLPSLAEGMSNALLEAMSVGVACVATRVGGNSELVEEGSSGLLFEAGDWKMLAAHLKTLALDPELRRDLGRRARRRVENCFSLDRMLSQYAHMYEGLLDRDRREVGRVELPALHSNRQGVSPGPAIGTTRTE